MALHLEQGTQNFHSQIHVEAAIPPEFQAQQTKLQELIAKFEYLLNMAAAADPEELKVDPLASLDINIQGRITALERLTDLRQARAGMRRDN